ncbi:MAG: DUF455 family protein [Planctomycetes bacterium]|nr:DUF455 family protein [Planctomycetota bacterium]MCB9918996.1 DUF455 family protein [Planctomycetota bacterium]
MRMALVEKRREGGSLEAWALEFVQSESLELKCLAPPVSLEPAPDFDALRIEAPGRPPELTVVPRAPRSIKRGGLRDPSRRAELLHAFWHHELQAAELMAWAILAFPEMPRAFRLGLLGIARDEIRHMRLYETQVERLGHRVGDFVVRDWFWKRVPHCATPLQFVAMMGMGLEAGNLDHGRRYVEWFRSAGDEQAARIQTLVAREEIGHVRFGVEWFRRLAGDVHFDAWRRQLVEPLSPRLFRDTVLDRRARSEAGMDDEFLDALDAVDSWS